MDTDVAHTDRWKRSASRCKYKFGIQIVRCVNLATVLSQ